MAKYNHSIEGKKAKFHNGIIELRSEKSERNIKRALDKKRGKTKHEPKEGSGHYDL